MKQLTIIFILLMSLITNIYAQKIVFNVYPYKDKNKLFKEYQPLIQHLEKKLNIPIKFTIAKDYKSQIELLQNNKAHITIMGPYNFTLAKQVLPNLHYVGTKQHYVNNQLFHQYQSIIITRKKSAIANLSELKNSRFGFTDKNSTSGYLIPSTALKKVGIEKNDFKQYFMLKAHHRVMEALSQGSIDAGATYYSNYERFLKKYGDIYTILFKSKMIPYDPIVVSPFLPKPMIQKISKAVLTYKIKIDDLEFNGFTKLDDKSYDFIRSLNK